MKFEIKEKDKGKEKVTYLSLKHNSTSFFYPHDIDVIAENEGARDFIITFRNGRIKRYTLGEDMAEKLGIERTADCKFKEEVS